MRWHNVAERVRGCLQWRLLLIGLIMLAAELGEGAANNWMALAVHSDHGQSAAMAALFFAAFAVGQAVARFLGGPVVDRLGRVAAVRWTSAIGVIGVAMFILCIDPWLVLLGSVLWAVGVSMGFPLGTSAAADSGPAPAVRVASASSIAYVANLAGPAVIGVLAESVGLLHSLWLIALALAASFVVAGVLRPRRPDPEERSLGVSSVPS
jgi:MFS family permease